MKIINELLKMFTYVTTGTTIAFIVYILIMGYDVVYSHNVAKIPLIGIMISLITVPIVNREFVTKKGMIGALSVHYVLTSVLMVAVGILFEWVRPVISEILLMLGCVAFVYLFSFVMYNISLRKEAQKINNALKEHSDSRE